MAEAQRRQEAKLWLG